MEENKEIVSNPVESEEALEPQLTSPSVEEESQLQKIPLDGDSAVTKAEKIEWHGTTDGGEEPSPKRVKLEPSGEFELQKEASAPKEKQNGVTPIKAESVTFQ